MPHQLSQTCYCRNAGGAIWLHLKPSAKTDNILVIIADKRSVRVDINRIE
jgi:hypothetical protein